METLRIYPTNINERHLAQAVEALKDGELIIYPTDSLYAIGCDALNERAIERVCRLKGINPQKENLSIVCSSISQAAEYAKIDNNAFAILKRYLPGPYTFILPASTRLPKVFKGRKTVGVRIPNNAIAQALAEDLGNPLLSTSVEYDATEPATGENPEELAIRYESTVDIMIDGGEGRVDPSTVVDLTDSISPEILRQGAGSFDD